MLMNEVLRMFMAAKNQGVKYFTVTGDSK